MIFLSVLFLKFDLEVLEPQDPKTESNNMAQNLFVDCNHPGKGL
jgi:hypothetical protein